MKPFRKLFSQKETGYEVRFLFGDFLLLCYHLLVVHKWSSFTT